MAALTVTRVTHSCVLLDFDGTVILTDPWFSEKPGYMRGEPLGFTVAQLPQLSGVIVSHGHYDHYDMAAFQEYRDKAVPMLVKRSIAEPARKVGFTNVTEMDAWETHTIGPVTITAAPAKHGVPEITYMLQTADFTVFFGADTLLIPELDEIPQRFPNIDLALVPVNGLQIRPALNKRVVMNAQQAAALCAKLRPRVAIPIHYAFTGGHLTDTLLLKYDGTPTEFAQAAATLAPATQVRILAPAEPLQLMPVPAHA